MSTTAQVAEMEERLISRSNKMKGYIEKKSSNLLIGYQSRFCLILDNFFSFFKDQSLTEPKGKIDLLTVTDIQKHSELQLRIVTPQRQFTFRFGSTHDRQDWFSCLCILKEYHQNGGYLSAQSQQKYYTIWKDVEEERKARRLTPQQQSQDDKIYRRVFKQLSLNLLFQNYSTNTVKSRVAILRFKQGYYFLVSCKSLQTNFDDELILPKQYIEPYDFNTVYAYNKDKREARMVITSSKIKECFILDYKYLKINEFLLTIQKDVRLFMEMIRASVEVGKEYHNPQNLPLRKNIDQTIKIFDKTSESQKLKIRFEVQYNQLIISFGKSYKKQYTIFSKLLQNLLSELFDFSNACKLKTPPRYDVLKLYVSFMHQKIYRLLNTYWNENHQTIQNENILRLAGWVSKYSSALKGIVKDERLASGIKILMDIYFRNCNTQLLQNVNKIYGSSSNLELSIAHLTKLPFELCKMLQDTLTHIEQCFRIEIINEHVQPMLKGVISHAFRCLEELSQKQKNISRLIGLCNDLTIYKKDLKLVLDADGHFIDKLCVKAQADIIRRLANLITSSRPMHYNCGYYVEILQYSQSLTDLKKHYLHQLHICIVGIICKDIVRGTIQGQFMQDLLDIEEFYSCAASLQSILQGQDQKTIVLACQQLSQEVKDITSVELLQLLMKSRYQPKENIQTLVDKVHCVSRAISIESTESDIFRRHIQQPRSNRSTLTLSLSSKCQLEGYLEVKEGMSKNYKQRYFRFQNRCLKEYHSASSREMISSIEMALVSKIETTELSTKFTIFLKDTRVYKFNTATIEICKRWSGFLGRLVEQLPPQLDRSNIKQQLFRDFFSSSQFGDTEPEEKKNQLPMPEPPKEVKKPQKRWFNWGCIKLQ